MSVLSTGKADVAYAPPFPSRLNPQPARVQLPKQTPSDAKSAPPPLSSAPPKRPTPLIRVWAFGHHVT